MKISDAIQILQKECRNPEQGLPEDLFIYVSSLIPMVNVDLLIKDQFNRTLLSWRDDAYCGTGWHVPGGIVRLKENLLDRVHQVIKTEIFDGVTINPTPIKLTEFIFKEKVYRCHFVSILYQGTMDSSKPLHNFDKNSTSPGYLQWFEKCPENLIEVQSVYKDLINQ